MGKQSDNERRRKAFLDCCEDCPRLARWARRKPDEVRDLFQRTWHQAEGVNWRQMSPERADEESEAIEKSMVANAQEQRYGVIETIIIGILVKLIIAWLTEHVFSSEPPADAE